MLENQKQVAKLFFQNVFRSMQAPVIVCENSANYPIVFANASAWLMMNPLLSTQNLKESVELCVLADMLRFQRNDSRTGLFDMLQKTGVVNGFKTEIISGEGELLSVEITANNVEMRDTQCIVMYVTSTAEYELTVSDVNNMLSQMFQITNHEVNVDTAINSMMAYVGNSMRVSRVYIFEAISDDMTRNTYEWCAPGIEPAIADLQNLKKEDHPYDVIVNSGLFITDDVRTLPERDRETLESQGIKSVAILPLFHADKPLGYIGYDDCEHYRKWNQKEILLLRSISSLMVSMLVRRNSEANMLRSREILQTISDSMENIIYVNDIKTYELVFINKKLESDMGRGANDIVGAMCWNVLQKDMKGPCPFCPIPKMIKDGFLNSGRTYTWEFQNTVTNKWYLIKDSFIRWIDGRQVHIETAIEITHQKEYEDQLKYYASTDIMTGVYNREWGYKVMQEMLSTSTANNTEGSLVFIDLDGLKQTNDTYGHDAGDRMINQTVDMIRSSIRKSDLICRWGGDEFIVLLRCGTTVAERIMHTIEGKLQQRNETTKEPFILGFSYGITELSRASTGTIDTVISRADQLMYQNKMARRQERQ